MNKVFITGGTGFIGSHLVDALISNSSCDNVRCLIRNEHKWLYNKDFEAIFGDMNNIDALKKGTEGVDTVFHCAAVVKGTTEDYFNYHNVIPTENLAQICLKQGVSKLIILSSLAAVGPSYENILNENSINRPLTMYGSSKYRMEKSLSKLANDKMSIIIVRPSVVFGPRDEQTYTLFKMASKGIFIAPKTSGLSPRLSMSYVEDVVQVMLNAAKKHSNGYHVYFTAYPEAINWIEYKDMLSRVLSRKVRTIYISPKWTSKMAKINEKTASVFGKWPTFNQEKAKEMIHNWVCSPQKAQHELAFKPKYTIEEAMLKTVHWYKFHHWI